MVKLIYCWCNELLFSYNFKHDQTLSICLSESQIICLLSWNQGFPVYANCSVLCWADGCIGHGRMPKLLNRASPYGLCTGSVWFNMSSAEKTKAILFSRFIGIASPPGPGGRVAQATASLARPLGHPPKTCSAIFWGLLGGGLGWSQPLFQHPTAMGESCLMKAFRQCFEAVISTRIQHGWAATFHL